MVVVREGENSSELSKIQRIAHQVVILRNVSKLFAKSERDIEGILFSLIHMIPEACSYPENMCVRVSLGTSSFQTSNFVDPTDSLKKEILAFDKVVGLIELGYLEKKPQKDDGHFPIDEKNFLEAVATELGLFFERVDIQRIQNQQKHELEIYSSLLRHDLKNDLGVILGNIDLARMITHDEEILNIITSTEAVCDRMMNILSAFGQSEKTIETNIVKILERTTSYAQNANKNIAITISVPSEIQELKIPESRLLPMVFDNLFRNAAAHAGEKPIVKIEVTRVENRIRILVEDNGPGVAKEIRKDLFKKGVSTRGGGLGLYLSKEIVTALGGSIDLLEEKKTRGASFEIILPIIP